MTTSSADCVQSNPEIRKWMDAKGMDNDFARLEEYFETKVLELAAAAGKSYIVWQVRKTSSANF